MITLKVNHSVNDCECDLRLIGYKLSYKSLTANKTIVLKCIQIPIKTRRVRR